jgi:hypothetical protein
MEENIEAFVNKQSANTINKTNNDVKGEQSTPEQRPVRQEAQAPAPNYETQGDGGSEGSSQDIFDSLDGLNQQKAQQESGVEKPKGQFATQEFQIGDAPDSWEIDKQNDFRGIPHYDKYEGSAWSDFYNGAMNAGVVRTAQGVANLIPSVASATTDAEWSAGWIDTVNDWADRNEGYVSQTGEKSFFDTWDVRSFAAGAGQGIGSMVPMIAAAAAVGATGGVGGLVMGTGVRAGMAAASASYGSAAGIAASTINMMPTIVEEGLANGLTHQEATSLSFAIAPVIGMMEKMGLDSAIKAGMSSASGSMKREIFGEMFKTMSRKGMTGKNFKGNVKLAIGEVAKNYWKDLEKQGIKRTGGQIARGIGKEVKLRGKDFAAATGKGMVAEGGTESLQSLVETAGKQIYDSQFSRAGTEAGKGQFGADIMSQEAWTQALEEGFYGGLIGGSFAATGRGFNGMRAETVTGALDNAHKKGNLKQEITRMEKVLDANPNMDEKERQDLKDIVTTAGQMITSMPDEVKSPNARHQIFKLSHLARELQDEIEESDVKNAAIGMEDLATAKLDKLERRLTDTKRAISDIYGTSQELDKDGNANPNYVEGGSTIDIEQYNEEKGEKEYFITDITGLAKQSKQAIRTTFGGKPDVNPDKKKAAEMRMEGKIGRVNEQIESMAQSIADGKTDWNPEEEQFRKNNSRFIEERLQEIREERTNLPALTTSEEVRVREEYESIQNPLKDTQDEDIEFVNSAAEQVHKEVYGEEASKRVQNVMSSLAEEDAAFDDDLNIRQDISQEQANKVIDKLVTARRAVLEMMEGETSTTAKEHLINADAFLRQKIQQAKKAGKLAPADVKQQKLIGDEQTKDTSKRDVSAESTKRESTTEQKTQRSPRQTQGTQSTKELAPSKSVERTRGIKGEAKPSATSDLKAGTQEGELSPKEQKAKKAGFKSWSHAINSVNKRRVERGESKLPVTKESFEALTDRQIETYGRMSDSAQDTLLEETEAYYAEEAKKDAQQDTSVDEDVEAKIDSALDNLFGESDTEKMAKTGSSTLISENKTEFDAILHRMRQIFPDIDINLIPEVFSKDGIEAMGIAYDNRVDISETKATQDVLFHELAHKFSRLLSGSRAWGRGMSLIKDTAYMQEAKKLYPELDEAGQAEEALVNMIGESSLEQVQAMVGIELMPKIKAWLKQIWSRLKYMLNKASAKDMAEIMAWDMTMKRKSVSGTGLQFGEKLKKLGLNESPVDTNAIRVAAIKSKIAINNNPELKAYSAAVMQRALRKAHKQLWDANKLSNKLLYYINSEESFKAWSKQFAVHIKHFEDTLYVPTTQESDNNVDFDADLSDKLDAFINGGEKLDENTRGILESLLDEQGNPMPTDRVYGVLVHIASINTEPAYFLRTLKEFADPYAKESAKQKEKRLKEGGERKKKEGVSSIDINAAKQLNMILSALPESIVRPVQAQLSSLVNVPHLNLSESKKGGKYVNFSNRKLNPKIIGDIIIERLLAANLMGSSSVESQKVRTAALAKAFGSARKALANAKRWNGQGDPRYINSHIADAVKQIKSLTGLPVNADWFGTDSTINVQLSYEQQAQNMINFLTAIQKSDEIINVQRNKEAGSDALKSVLYQEAIIDARKVLYSPVKRISKMINTSYGERTVFRNVLGNQQMGHKVGGLLHKTFSNRSMVDKDWFKHVGLKPLGEVLLKNYREHWVSNIKNGVVNVAHSDGFINQKTGEAVQFEDMEAEDSLEYYFHTLFGTTETIVDNKTGEIRTQYMNSVGTLSNRKFMAFVNMPMLTTEEATKAVEAILAKNEAVINEEDKIPEGVLPTKEGIAEGVEDAINFLEKMAESDPGTFIRMAGALSNNTVSSIYQTQRAIDGDGNSNAELNAVDETGISKVQQMLVDKLLTEVPAIAERMMTNESLNRYIAKTVVVGDLSKFSSANEILKRIDKATSPVVNLDLRENQKDEIPETITIVLEDIPTEETKNLPKEDQVSASDSWTYFSDYIGDKIERQGGDLIPYGRNHKPLVNDVSDEGDFTFIKMAAESFQGLTNEEIAKYNSLKDGGGVNSHGRIGLALRKIQAANPGVPIIVTYVTAVKSDKSAYKNKDGNFATLADLENAAETGSLDGINYTKKVFKNFGLQFNINKDVSKPGVDTALSTQLLNVVIAGMPKGTDIKTFQNLLAEITNERVTEIVNQLGNKAASLREALKQAGEGVSPSVKALIEDILATKTDEEIQKMKFDHYDISMVLQNWQSAQTSKGVKLRVPGAKLVQSTDIDGDLKYHTYNDGDAKITEAEVLVPEGHAEIGETLIEVRVPLSNKINILVAKVVGHTAPGGNKIVMPSGWIDASNSDNDGDTLLSWKLGKKDGDVKINKLFNEAVKLLTNKALWSENGGYKEKLTTDKLVEAVYKAEVKLGLFPDVASAKKAQESSFLKMNSARDEANTASKLKESGKLVGILAVGAKVINALSTAGVELDSKYGRVILPENVNLPTEVSSQKGGNFEFTVAQISQVAESLQMALDDASKVFMWRSGITKQNANMVVLLLGVGYDLTDVIVFLKSPSIKKYESVKAENKRLLGNVDNKNEAQIREQVLNELRGEAQNNEEFKKQVAVLDAYWKIKSQSEIIRLVSRVTQMDKGTAGDNVSLMSLKGDIKNLKQYKGVQKLGDLLTNPVVLSRLEANNKLEQLFSEFFSAVSTTNQQVLSDTLDSFDSGNMNINSKKKARIAQKVLTKTTAQKLSKYKYTPEALVDMANNLMDYIEVLKRNPDVEAKGWLSLIGAETIENEDGTFTNVKLIPTYRNTIPELDMTEQNNVNDVFLEEQWNKLAPELQEQILEYAIHVEGLINEGRNISHLIPSKVYRAYFDELLNIKQDEVISEEYMDNIIREGNGMVKVSENPWKIEDGDTSISLTSDKGERKYFKVGSSVYKKTSQEQIVVGRGTIQFVIEAELLHSPEDNFTLANRETVQYKLNDGGKPDSRFADDIDFEEVDSTTEAQNKEASAALDVAEALRKEFMDRQAAEDSDEQFQKISTGEKNADSKKVNRRILRRLSQKFNIPYRVINDPESKFKGFYDKKTNTVVINEAYASADTPLHEFAHPFITSIKKRNPELYAKLSAEIQTSEEGKAELERVKNEYPELSEEGQVEEAMVALLGKLAEDKIVEKDLKEQLIELWNQIVATVKQLFGVKADIIQEEMSENTTLGDLADMLLDTKSTIDIDIQLDDQFRRAMDYASRSAERIQKLFNPAVEVVQLMDTLSDEQKNVHNSLTESGFLSNNNFIVKQTGAAFNGESVLSFRAPISMIATWKDDIKAKYPESQITDKGNSPVKGFIMYEISLGDGSLLYVYQPKNSRAAKLGSIAHANLQYDTNPQFSKAGKNINSDKNIFDGHGFDIDEFEVSDVEQGAGTEERIRYYKGLQADYIAKYGGLPKNKADKKAMLKFYSTKVQSAAIRAFEKHASVGRLSGNLQDVVNLNLIKLSQENEEHQEAWFEYMQSGDLRSAVAKVTDSRTSQDFVNAISSFERMMDITSYNEKNKDYVIVNGKRVVAAQVSQDIVNKATEATSQRTEFFEKYPLIGQLYKTLTKTFSGLRNFTLNMLTPEVMANVATGQYKNFLHKLVSDDMLKGDEKDAVFKDEVMDEFRKRMSPEAKEALTKYSDWMNDEPSSVKGMAIKGLGSNIPYAKALSLYLALRQPDIKSKAKVGGKGLIYEVSYFDEVTQKEKVAKIDGDVFLKNFEAAMVKNPPLANMIEAIDATLNNVHDRVNPAVKSFMGVGVQRVVNYFPTRYGTRSSVLPKGVQRKIEDFGGMKERSLENRPVIKLDDAFSTMDSYVNQASKFNAYAEPISNLRKVIQGIESSEGYDKDTHGGIVSYINDMINNVQDYQPVASLTDNAWDRSIRKGMNNFTLAVLGWNPAVALKQVVSVMSAAPELGMGVVTSKAGRAVAMRILKASYKDTKFGKGQIGQLNLKDETLVEIMDLSPLMKQRFKGYIDRDQGEYRSHGMNPFSADGKKTKIFGKKFQMDKTMELIKINDAAAIAWLYESIKEQNTKDGVLQISQDELKKKFEDTVMRTQPTYNISSRTNLSRSPNQLMRLFTMFSSQRAKNMNMMMNAIVNYATNPDERSKKNLKVTLWSIGILASLGIAVIDKLKYALMGGGEDDEDLVDSAVDLSAMTLLNTVGNVYFAGQFAQMVDANIRNKPFGKSVEHPVFQTASIAAKGVADLSKGDLFKSADAAIQTSMRIIGAPLWPYTNVVRKGAKSVGSGSSGSKSAAEKYLPGKDVSTNQRWSKSLEDAGLANYGSQGEGATATEKAQQMASRTALIKADISLKKSMMELTEKNRARRSRNLRAILADKTKREAQANIDRRLREKYAREDAKAIEDKAKAKAKAKAKKIKQ